MSLLGGIALGGLLGGLGGGGKSTTSYEMSPEQRRLIEMSMPTFESYLNSANQNLGMRGNMSSLNSGLVLPEELNYMGANPNYMMNMPQYQSPVMPHSQVPPTPQSRLGDIIGNPGGDGRGGEFSGAGRIGAVSDYGSFGNAVRATWDDMRAMMGQGYGSNQGGPSAVSRDGSAGATRRGDYGDGLRGGSSRSGEGRSGGGNSPGETVGGRNGGLSGPF